MASSSSSSPRSEPAKMEQIITEFFAKSLHIILESRSPTSVSSRNYYSGDPTLSPCSSSSSSSSVRPRDKWFNLALRECPAAMENLDFWRHSNLEPMYVDVVLVQKAIDLDRKSSEGVLNFWNFAQDEVLEESKSQKIVERWVVQYESRRSRESGSGSKRANCSSSHSLYRKCIVLLRSLYLTVRILPAFKLFRDLNSSGQIRTFGLANRVASFVEPFTRREEAEMQKFEFTPVDTTCGRLCLSVLYQPVIDVSSEPLTPLSQQVISDYVGSPLNDPLKRFPSLPVAGLVSLGSPSNAPFPRVRSCGYELYRACIPSPSSSPSPTHHPRPVNVPHRTFDSSHSRNALSVHKNASFDEYWPSPMFSPSPSPSPPAHCPHTSLSKCLLRSESAPERENIHQAKPCKNSGFPNCHVPPLSPSPRGGKLGFSQRQRSGDVPAYATGQKKNPYGKDEIENLSEAKLSTNSSPRISFSRSSVFTDDDSDFPCPFVDDDDEGITDPRFRPESFDGRAHQAIPLNPGGLLLPMRRSQDAAIGDLVRMLKAASPLQQDASTSTKSSQVSKADGRGKSITKLDEILHSAAVAVQITPESGSSSCGLQLSKTTAEALGELQNYREIKEMLLRQSDMKYFGCQSKTAQNDSDQRETTSTGTIGS
ncbi:hypothetical protein Sjap_018538 [Stephania japonica]|uniref:Autophagy-related protein 13 N-terminal domain-containing protein n=1 Tax=Stephania japonica TaxID=461633 RepID=A0AAP0I8D9_9MAGN